MLGTCPPIEVVAIHGPARAPVGKEILKLPGNIAQILTPTATLEWAIRDRYRPAAIARLKVAEQAPAETVGWAAGGITTSARPVRLDPYGSW
jgi:hypothetical protein